MGMKKSILMGMMIATMGMANITLSQAQSKKIGITTTTIHRVSGEAMGPFMGLLDYSDQGSKKYLLSSEATVVELIKQTGDRVNKKEAVCTIASSELLASHYEWIEVNNRLKIAQEYAQKDSKLYNEGVISQRESQKSALEMMSLKTKRAEIENRFMFAGADRDPKGGMLFTIRATRSGIIAHAPLKAGEKITPFTPYLTISNPNALSAYLKIPPKLISSIHKGAVVRDKEGEIVGRISAISSSVDRMNNSALAIAILIHPKESYRAGTSSEFFIASPSGASWILLPRVSVTKYQGKDICFVKTPTGFSPRTVKIQQLFQSSVAVEPHGLQEGDQVVMDGIMNLKGMLSGMGFE
jgi:cobalt-zinc-cadmium efflux system membrane fusion protein